MLSTAVFGIEVFRTVIATGLHAFYLIIFEFLLEMGRRLSNKKAFSNNASSSVSFLIPPETLISYGEGDTLGRLLGPQ